MVQPLTYLQSSDTKEFHYFNEFHCYSLDAFDFSIKSGDSSHSGMFDAQELLDIPMAITTSKHSSLFTTSTKVFTKWSTPPSKFDDEFCSEKVSKLNNRYSQSLMMNLNTDSPFFSSFFQTHHFYPLLQERIHFELTKEILKERLHRVEKYSLFKNYMFYFSPVIVFGVILVFLLFKKLISEVTKYREKFN